MLLISTIQAWTEIQNKAVGHFALAVLAIFFRSYFWLVNLKQAAGHAAFFVHLLPQG